MDLLLTTKTTARAWARKLGLIPLLSKIRRTLDFGSDPARYEQRFGDALLGAVRPGDCVWDVGANVGYYTALLSERTGPQGTVCAFEPAPTCFRKIQERQLPNCRPFQLALGSSPSTMRLGIDLDPLGTGHSLVTGELKPSNFIEVQVVPGDQLVDEKTAPPPNVVKVDVEGFEDEVLQGLAHTFARPECRAVLCEIHFKILEHRGMRHAPAAIVKRLQQAGFRTRWLDSSHLEALR